MIRNIHGRDDYYTGGMRFAVFFHDRIWNVELLVPDSIYSWRFQKEFIAAAKKEDPEKVVERLIELYEYFERCTHGDAVLIFRTNYAVYQGGYPEIFAAYGKCLLHRLTQKQFSKKKTR